jgi:hypothetical protein
MILPRFVYLKKKKIASTNTATPAEPKADKIPMRMPLPVEPPSFVMLMTIDDGGVSLCMDSTGCRDAEPNDMVDVGSCIGEASRVEVERVEYIRSPITAPASHLIACDMEEVGDVFVEVEIEMAHLRYARPGVGLVGTEPLECWSR